MNFKMLAFGKQIQEEMDCILCYNVTRINNEDKDICMIIDMRNDYGKQSGLCLIKENRVKMTDAQLANMYADLRPGGSAKGYEANGQVKPDAVLNMTEQLFNELSEG